MIKNHPLNLSKPDTILANDCLKQLEQLGVLDKKSKKRIRSNIKSGYATHTGNKAVNHIYGFITELFSGVK